MTVEWAVIPVAGRGTRMYPLSRAIPKELLPLGRRPVLQYVVEELIAAGLRDLVFVTSPDKPALRSLLGDAEYWREQLSAQVQEKIRLHLVEQKKQLGLGDAVYQSRALIQDRPFVVALGDCVIRAEEPAGLLRRMLQRFDPPSCVGAVALEHVPRDEVYKYGIAQLNEEHGAPRLADLIEKPTADLAPSQWAVAGRYVFTPLLFRFLESTSPGHHGEVQLTDAIRAIIRQDYAVAAVTLGPGEERIDVGEFIPYFKAFREFAAAEQPNAAPSSKIVASRELSARSATGRAFARAGLLGNPSDGYGGKTISLAVMNWRAEVQLVESGQLCFPSGPAELQQFDSVADFIRTVKHNGYYSGLRLIQATVKKFFDWFPTDGKSSPCFTIQYRSDIPRQLGLGGSSAIVIATWRALLQFHRRTLSPDILAAMALSVEADELGIPAGPQDRVIQAYEGLMYMDFAADRQTQRQGLSIGHYERLDDALLPPLYIATLESAAEPTEVIHGDLRQRYLRGDREVILAMQRFAQLAESGREALVHRDAQHLGELINANFDLRRSICRILPEHNRMVDTARSVGVSAKFCGSGGAIIGICPEGDTWMKLCRAMAGLGAQVVRPQIGAVHSAATIP